MRVPQQLEKRLEEIRREMRPPPHAVKVKRVRTSYADLETREVVLAERQLGEVDWVYRHEVEHLGKWPRTLGRELYWAAKVANRVGEDEREFLRKHRNEVMNIAEDTLIDYEVGKKYRDARKCIKRYVKNLDPYGDLPPHEVARLIVAGVRRDYYIEELLKKRDIVGLGILALEWLEGHPEFKVKPDVKGKPSKEDFEEAASDLIREGEDLEALDDFARDEDVEWDFEKAAIMALVKSYDWYLSASRHREVHRGSRARQSVWNPGDSPEKLDVNGSLTVFPKVIPGLTAVKREVRPIEGFEEPTAFKDVALLVDESGSMDDKVKAVRVVGISILGYLNRKRVQYQIISFGSHAAVRVPLGFDYTAGVWYFARRYAGWQGTTEIAPALKELMGRDLLVYVISDAEIFDLNKVAEYRHMLKEVVLVLINQRRRYGEFVQAFGGVPVRGYWLHPDRVEEFVVEELGRLS